MSSLPLLVRNVRFGTILGVNYLLEDHVKKEVVDSFTGKSFHKMAENNAKIYGVTREEADKFAEQSHSKWKTGEYLIQRTFKCTVLNTLLAQNPAH